MMFCSCIGIYNVVLCPSLFLSPFFPGVPLSTQWGPQGYFYAIQIAQYGLSHFSKNLTERAPHVEVYDTAEEHNSKPNAWSVPKGCTLTTSYDKTHASSVRLFNAPGTDTGELSPSVFLFLYIPTYFPCLKWLFWGGVFSFSGSFSVSTTSLL